MNSPPDPLRHLPERAQRPREQHRVHLSGSKADDVAPENGRLLSLAAAPLKGQNRPMRALILKVLLGIAIGLIVIAIFILFGHTVTPV
jgi:hypothetical protein